MFFKNKINIPTTLKKLNSIFEKNGFEAYLVGGAVRDVLLGKEASDWDVTTNAKPEEVMKMFYDHDGMIAYDTETSGLNINFKSRF